MNTQDVINLGSVPDFLLVSLQPFHVLRAMGVPFTMARGSIRFSVRIYNTEAESDFVIKKTASHH